MAKGKVVETVESLGEYLKEQRVSAQLSLRQLAEHAGVSNPYLSQIERGLRRPSAEVLNQIAKALRISAEQLYVRAGIVSPEVGRAGSVELAVLADPGLTERQKQSLLDVYASFQALNARDTEIVSIEPAPAADPESLPVGVESLSWNRTTRPTTIVHCITQPKEQDMATAKFDIKTEATKTLYAGAGVVDLGVEVVRDAVADAQKRFAEVQKNVSSYDLSTASKQAKARRDAVEKRVVELQDEARTLPKKVQGLVKDNVDTATDTYEDLAKRGQTLVRRIRRQEATKATAASAKQTVRGAKTTTTQGTKAAKSTTATAKRAVKSTAKSAAKKSASARSSAKGTATSARKTTASAAKATTAAASKVGN